MIPKHPRKHSRWGECYICGFDFPIGEMVRHYKTRRLVDKECADELSFSDYKETQIIPAETRETSEQPVED